MQTMTSMMSFYQCSDPLSDAVGASRAPSSAFLAVVHGR